MIRPPPRSTPLYSSAASDVYKRQRLLRGGLGEPAVDPAVGLPPVPVVLRRADHVVRQRPQRVVGETLVVVGDVLDAELDRDQPHAVGGEREVDGEAVGDDDELVSHVCTPLVASTLPRPLRRRPRVTHSPTAGRGYRVGA